MIARLLALSAAAVFSFSCLATGDEKADKTAESMKQLVSCGELQAAKHLTITVALAIGAVFVPAIAQDLQTYEAAMNTAKTCKDLDGVYKILEEIAKKNQMDPEQTFSTPEGKEQLEELASKLKVLKEN